MSSMCRIHSILCRGIKNASSFKCGGLSQNILMSQLQITTKTYPHLQKIPQKFSTSTSGTGTKLCSHVRAPGPLVLKTMVALTMPLSFKSAFDRLLGNKEMIIPTVGNDDNIPREVYQEVVIIKREPGFLMKIVYFFWNVLRISFRTIRIICTLVPLFCFYPLTWTSVWINEKWWNLLVLAIQSIGPTFVKLGQWASTRRDLFSDNFCNKLSKLHRRTKPHSWYFTKKKLEKGFGKRWKEILKFDDKHHPIGSGCVAQVYKAYMPQEMVLDDDVLNEILLEIEDHDDPTIMDAFEVLGFHDIIGQIDKGLDDDSDANSSFEGKPYVETAKRPHAVPLPSVAGKTAGQIKPPKLDKAKPPPARPGPQAPPSKEGDSGPPPGLVPVAVKVLHPGIYRAVQRDIKILRFLAKVVEFIFPNLKWLSVRECVEEFADLMERQIDLRVEARCLDKFYDNFEDNPNIRFPRPVRPFVKRSILVETFEEGEPMSKYMRRDIQAAEGLKEKIASIGIEALLQMIFQDNFVHGDLHPGNILIMNAAEFEQQDDSKLVLVDVCDTLIINVKPVECPLRLVLLDVGIVSQLSEKDKENFTEVFRAVVLGEGEKVGELLLDNACHQECVNMQGFKDDIADIVNAARKQTIKLGKIQAAELLTSVFSTLSRHKVKLESNFASIVIAIMVLEGLGRVLDPELDLLEKARPMLLSSS
ncbi:uncharacterized aarF domain-containing protein kinase 2-like [Lineus longissimus]|uniref:uncharacterized aarF domain-containing protein kinase 2-like n=1 Tax=Lineus longissimus TaxID=88925 RepID=UPI002B4E8672